MGIAVISELCNILTWGFMIVAYLPTAAEWSIASTYGRPKIKTIVRWRKLKNRYSNNEINK